MKNCKILTLEQALKEGRELAFPMPENRHDEQILIERRKYVSIVRQMYKKGMIVGVK